MRLSHDGLVSPPPFVPITSCLTLHPRGAPSSLTGAVRIARKYLNACGRTMLYIAFLGAVAAATHADTLTSTTDQAAFTSGESVSWATWFADEFPGAWGDFALSNVVTADATGVLQATGLDYPVTPFSMTATDPLGGEFYSSDTFTLGLTGDVDYDYVLFEELPQNPITFTFTQGNVDGFGINLYGFTPIGSATLAAYNAADVLIGSVTIDSPTQFVGILDDSIDIASVTLSTDNDNSFAFGNAYTMTPEPGTFLLFSLPLAVLFFKRVKSTNAITGGSK